MGAGRSDVELILTGQDFSIARQLTRQMVNVRREVMVEQGWTREANTALSELVKSIPRDIAPQARIKIIASDHDIDRSASPAASPGLDGEEVRYVSRSVFELWPTLLTATWELLGDLEARYRTGYDPDEITAALASITDQVPPPVMRTYTVKPGDTLWAIAERFYGDAKRYLEIADASGLDDPPTVEVGQVLRIPRV